MTLQRGFKAAAEREAKRVRKELGLAPNDGIDPREVAASLQVKVVDAATLVSREELEELDRLQAYAFSAVTFEIDGRQVIVVHPLRSIGRQNSDIAHELAHIILKHELSEIRELDGVPFRTCQPDEEEEANTLGATLLLPRELLVSAARRGSSIADVADQYNVTTEMARYRFNATGVPRQLGITIR